MVFHQIVAYIDQRPMLIYQNQMQALPSGESAV